MLTHEQVRSASSPSRQQSKIRAWARSVMARQQRLQTSNAFMMTTRDVVKEPLLGALAETHRSGQRSFKLGEDSTASNCNQVGGAS